MPSPFPGMDPYLESSMHWGSVHDRVIAAIEAQFNRNLPAGYVAELDQYVWLTGDTPDERELLGRPDAFVLHEDNFPLADSSVSTTIVVEPMLKTTLPKSKKLKRNYVKITSANGAEVLAVVELLSPSNKQPGPDRMAYLAKRGEYRAAGVNLIEIDLLRAGDRLPMGRPQPPVTDYYLLRCTRDEPSRASIWAFGVRETIPVIAVPFRAGIAPVALDLRACLDRAYDDGRYRDKLNYSGPCDPALRREDAEWASGLRLS